MLLINDEHRVGVGGRMIGSFDHRIISAVGKMWNCGMRKVKCGTTLIGRSSKSLDRCLSAYYHNDMYIHVGMFHY